MATKIRNGEIAMMGEQTGHQPKIFYPHMNLEQKVPRTHLLRRIQDQIDFNFIYAEVRDTRVDLTPVVRLIQPVLRRRTF